MKLESYGSAISDAETALSLDPNYLKAYYRRGSARLALTHYKDAKKDFGYVVKLRPDDPDAKNKLSECEKAIKRQAFELAIATESSDQKLTVDSKKFEHMDIPNDYKGPHLPSLPSHSLPLPHHHQNSSSSSTTPVSPNSSNIPTLMGATASECAVDPTAVNPWGISVQFVTDLMEYFRSQKLLHKKYVYELLYRVRHLLASYPSLVHVPWPNNASYFNVCGDTHGQYYDTLNIFKLSGIPSPTNPYIFNGDFVDRGSFSVENVLVLFAWKLLYPDYVHLTRGNHEGRQINRMYGFEGEVLHKYDSTTMDMFSEVFHALPLSICIDKRVLVVHGGLCQKDGVLLDEISRIDRFKEIPESGLMSDLLWSDPQPFPGRGPSKRGVGKSFGPDITAKFLSDNNLEYLIRSHEVKDDGYLVEHSGKCITIFSAPNYCDTMSNLGAICRVSPNKNEAPTFITFRSVPHPPIGPMAYSRMGNMYGL